MERPEGPTPVTPTKQHPKAQGRHDVPEVKDAHPRHGPHLDSPVAGGGASVRKRWHWWRYSRHFCTVSERDTVAPCGEGRHGAPLFQASLSSNPHPQHTWFLDVQVTWSPDLHQCWQSEKGTGPSGASEDVFMSLSLPAAGAQSEEWQCPASVS